MSTPPGISARIPLSALRRKSPGPTAQPGDGLGRPLRDLRISVTDRCNFRCPYCMPREHFAQDHAFLPRSEILDFEEIARTARIAAALGVTKLRITGGEPLLRRDLPRLVALLAEIPDVELALTTNGVLLARYAQALREAGLTRVTVSLDALDTPSFARMSDSTSSVQDVLAGIAAAQAAGFSTLKINTVVKRGVNEHAVLDLVRHFRGSGVVLRFIEYMDVGTRNAWRHEDVVSATEIRDRIAEAFPLTALDAQYHGEVARRWQLADGSLELGFIASVTQAFCRDCTRLRLSPEGKLFTCLFASSGHDLRAHLRSGEPDEAVAAWMAALWSDRADRYSELRRLDADPGGEKIEMSYIGG